MSGRAGRSLIARIDQAFSDLPEIRPGAEPYLRRLAERGRSGGELPRELLRRVVVDVAAESYRDHAAAPIELLQFSDGAFDVMFDAAHELTILMHGLSQATLPNSRDRNYHNRRLSPLGSLWRDIEAYLAAHEGLFCFVRLAYPDRAPAERPRPR